MDHMNPKIDFYFDNAGQWQKETRQLRKLLLGCSLEETLKWGVPCYTSGGSNIVLIHTFKEYCALLFFKGALLKDPQGILVQQTKQVQAARQVRFTDVTQVVQQAAALRAYVYEAIEVEKAGLKVTLKKTEAYEVPEELQQQLKERPELAAAFRALTPGRQRAYLLYFSQAKQTKTRLSRIEKCTPQILVGKGLND